MPEPTRLANQLQLALNGDAWHGSSIADLLRDVTAAEAASYPIPGAHSIWEITLHINGWLGEVLRRLGGKPPGEPAEGDWPIPAQVTPAQWDIARKAIQLTGAELVAAIRATPESRLDEVIGAERDAPLGTEVTYYVMLHGVIEHSLYHAGQAALLKRAVRV